MFVSHSQSWSCSCAEHKQISCKHHLSCQCAFNSVASVCISCQACRIQVFGRSVEVQRVIQILARRSKNNPILLGEPGVGKTAIAEGLAHCIVRGFCPDGTPLPSFLTDKKIMQLDVGLLIAGAKERGELEKRISGMLAELKTNKDIILM